MKKTVFIIFILFLLVSCGPVNSDSSAAYTEFDYAVKETGLTYLQFVGKPFPVQANNCGGVEPVTQTTTRSQKFTAELNIQISDKVIAELGGDIKIAKAIIGGEIGVGLGIGIGVENEVISSLESVTPPGTQTTAMLQWKAKWTAGEISIIRPDGTFVDILPFAVLNSLNLEQQNITTVDCATGQVISQSSIEQVLPTVIPQPGLQSSFDVVVITSEPETVVVTATPLEPEKFATSILPTETRIVSQSPNYGIDHEDYLQSSINEYVTENSLLCLTTGPIIVQDINEPVQFPGDGRATAICWIGPQQATATNLVGSSLKRVSISSGNPEDIAIILVRTWGEEMTTRSDGCGASYGPCYAADLVVIRSDGSVIRP